MEAVTSEGFGARATPMTDSHDALYRAICAQPDEDTPRLVFADLVEENGDPLRARFIRAQVALARLPAYDPAWVSARQHEPDSSTGHCMVQTLPKGLPDGVGWHRFEFRRGFPWKIGVSALNALVPSGDTLFAAAPIQALDFDDRSRPDLAALAEWPQLARLRKLEFSAGWFGALDVARLAQSEYAGGVAELGFEREAVAPEGLRVLAESSLLGQLTALELRAVPIAPALLADALGAAREPGALSRLSLPFNRLGHDDAEHLFHLPLLAELQHLDVSNNPISAGGVTALAESGVVRGLRVLNLSKTKPGVPGVKALVEAGGLAGLRALDLSDNLLGPVAVKALAGCGGLRGLRVLNLSNNLVGDAGAAVLATARSLSGLLELDLRDADVGDAGAVALAESPHLDGLLRLDLSRRDGRSLGRAARAALVERFGSNVSL